MVNVAADPTVVSDLARLGAKMPQGLSASCRLGAQPRGTKYSRFIGTSMSMPGYHTPLHSLNTCHVAHDTSALTAGALQARIQQLRR
jgi:hypothetical protein